LKTVTTQKRIVITITLFCIISLLTACGGNTPVPINAIFEGDQYSQAGDMDETIVEEKACTLSTDPLEVLKTSTKTVMGCPETQNKLGEKSLKYIKGLDCDLIVAVSPDDIIHMPFYTELISKLIPADDVNSQDILSILEAVQEISVCVDVNSWILIQSIIAEISGLDPNYDNLWDNADMQFAITATEGSNFVDILKAVTEIPDDWKTVLEEDDYINGTQFLKLAGNLFVSLGHERIVIGVREKTLQNTFSDLPSVLDDVERMHDWNISKTSTVRALIGASLKKAAFDLLKDPDPEAEDAIIPSATEVDAQVDMFRELIQGFLTVKEIEATEIPESAAILIGLTANQDFICTEISGMVNNERIALNLNYLNSGRLRDYGLKLETLIEKLDLLTMLSQMLGLDETPEPTIPADSVIDLSEIEHSGTLGSFINAGDLPNTLTQYLDMDDETEPDDE